MDIIKGVHPNRRYDFGFESFIVSLRRLGSVQYWHSDIYKFDSFQLGVCTT
jgi:hypothetical protein